jgi:acyl-CoA synthetase (AMP-forming)/AMP-acid ligase II
VSAGITVDVNIVAARTDISSAPAFVRANRQRLLGEDLARNATNFPRRVALHDVETGWRMTFREFDRRVNAAASSLSRRGLAQGDRVCMLGRNHLDTLTLYYAGCRLGTIFVPLNYNANTEELRYIIEDASPSAIAVSSEFLGHVDAELLQGLDVFSYSPDGKSGDVAEWSRSEASGPDADADDRACAFILYTGGTTGRPKGVMLSQAGYLAMADNTIESLAPLGFGRFDSWLVSGPLYHGAALAYAVTGLHFAQTVHLLPQFDAANVLSAIARGFGTITWFIPTMSRRIIDTVIERSIDLASIEGLRLIISAGAPLSLALRQELHRTFRRCQVVDMVGQTELTSTITAHSEPSEIEAHPTAVGYPAPGVTVALLDDANRAVPEGEAGELCYRSESLMLGYWNKPDATCEAMAGGWFHSGDLGRRDASGLIHIVGRKKELIKSGGENIIPNEVEHVLRGVPGVADACVLGISDELWGERVHAVLAVGEGRGDAESIRDAAEAAARTALSRYKVPKTWSVLATLPATAVGKIDKAALRTLVGDGKKALDLRPSHRANQKV